MAQELTREEAFTELARRGIVHAVVFYQGGGDEGGVDAVELFDYEIEDIDDIEDGHDYEPTLSLYEPDFIYNPAVCGVEHFNCNNADERLAGALCGPLYSKYIGFDGEPYVTGKILWDVASGVVRLMGEESETVYNSIEELL